MNYLISIMPYLLLMGLFYLFILIPDNKRKKQYKTMLDNLKINDEIITKGGILGKIVTIQDKFVILETGPDKIRIKLDKKGIANIMVNTSIEDK